MTATRVVALALLVAACSKNKDEGPEPPAITAEWKDDFERSELGSDWRATSGAYQLVNGAVSAQGAYNHPLWLRRKLPRDAEIELDVWSNSPEGDIKIELYGDGRSFDPDKGGYKSTGYVAVMGGWKNTKSQIARLDEHGKDIAKRAQPAVEVSKRYHWKFVRRGGKLDWFVDDMATPFLSFDDPKPLEGTGHEYFAIDNWQTDTWFDNLRINPL